MIKTILASTDFSEVSINALRFAAAMASKMGAKLIVFNVYFNHDMEIRIPELMPTVDSMKEYSMDELKKIAKQLKDENAAGLEIEYECADGFTVAEIANMARAKNADLVVVGMTGAGLAKERLVGSTATALMRKSPCPVMVIHKKMVFKPFEKIVLTCDYVEMKTETVLKPLKDLADSFHSQVLILHAAHHFEVKSNMVEKEKVAETLKDVPCLFFTIEQGDLVDKINSFALEHHADLVVMIPHHRSFIDKLLFEPDTKRMAFHAITPILALHDL